ncbi:MAG: hypothetical protein HF973_19010 [Chloroflexi bacterium]|nr:hypothetical protein [Chloroflexota bacterium]
MQSYLKRLSGPSAFGWALLLLAIVGLAAVLRLGQLGSLPPGLYRDEAFNGLDALRALEGNGAIFFEANNGREPLYIYLTAAATALFGRSAASLRLAAALTGILTAWLTYKLAAAWFDRLTGLFAAFIWAATLWAVHLSRVGLRPILLVAALTLTFWLATLAYEKSAADKERNRFFYPQSSILWFAAGLAYGVAFYTYLAVRFTPLLLVLIIVYLAWRDGWKRLWPGLVWFGLGTAVIITPLVLFYVQHFDLFLGRAGQVSIFNPVINGGDLWGALWRQTGRALGMFLWRGDSIVRHNPSGRPVFDWLMAVPFLLGLVWCVRHWRRAGAMILLLWTAVMLMPTILAEDTPHFLRVVGVLPAVLIFPAIGLAQIWRWERLPAWLRQGGVIVLLAGSLLITLQDYVNYGNDPETALMFEAAAVALAADLQAEAGDTAVYLDRWFWDEPTQKGWPSIPYLTDLDNVQFYRPESGLPPPAPGQPVSIYAWRFGDLSFVPGLMPAPGIVNVKIGPLARGDLETEAYPLYVRYQGAPGLLSKDTAANFGGVIRLEEAALSFGEDDWVVDLTWGADTAVAPHLVAFVHLVGPEGILAQSDLPPGGGNWLPDWWQPGQIVREQRRFGGIRPYNPQQDFLRIGVYNAQTGQNLPLLDESGKAISKFYILEIGD